MKLVIALSVFLTALSSQAWWKNINTCKNPEYFAAFSETMNSDNPDENIWDVVIKKDGSEVPRKDPRWWFTMKNKKGLETLCDEALDSQYAMSNNLQPASTSVEMVNRCGFIVWRCRYEKDAGGRDQDSQDQSSTGNNGSGTDNSGGNNGGDDDNSGGGAGGSTSPDDNFGNGGSSSGGGLPNGNGNGGNF